MKWSFKEPEVIKLGKIRHRTKFAWLPVKIQDHWVWLERYKALEEYSTEGRSYRVQVGGPIHHYQVSLWKELERGYLTDDVEAIHQSKKDAELRELNARGGMTLQQFLDKPADLTIDEYLSGISSTARGKAK